MRLGDLRRLRVRAQRLHPRVRGGVADLLAAVFALQAQDAAAAALSVRARTTGLVAADVERARVEERSIVRTWCMRGTLHLVPAEDVRWLLALYGPRLLAGRARRYAQLGLDEATRARGSEVVRKALADGPLERAEIGERLASAGIDPSGQRLIHLIGLCALLGDVCYGPGETFVLLDDWIAPAAPRDLEAAAAELARRYHAAYAPADAGDFAAWAGLPVRVARAAWARAALPPDQPPDPPDPHAPHPSDGPVVRLLPAFDTYLLGYASRAFALAPEHAKAVHPGGGWIHPTVTVDGEVVGTWRRRAGAVEVSPFHTLPAGLDTEVADVARFLS